MRRLLVGIALALLLVPSTGCHKKKKRHHGEAADPPARSVEDRVEVDVNDGGFHPAHIAAQGGRAITLSFRRTDESACKAGLVIPEESLRRQLPVGERVEVVLLPGRPGTIRLTCPGDRFEGSVDVQ